MMPGPLKIISFGAEAEARAFSDLVWIGVVKQQVGIGETTKKLDGTLINSVGGMSDAEIGTLKILGHLGGVLQTQNGSTTGYADPVQAYGQDPEKWYIPAPIELEEAGYIDLSAYSVIDLPEDWEPPFQE